MKETKYKTIKDLPSTVECWDEHETIPVNTVCNVKYWNCFVFIPTFNSRR